MNTVPKETFLSKHAVCICCQLCGYLAMPLHFTNSVQPVCPLLELGQNFQEVDPPPTHLLAAWTEVTSRQRRTELHWL